MEKLRSDKMEKYGYGYELANRYVFRRKLGQGASGSVYMAFDVKLNKCWAVKVCSRRAYECVPDRLRIVKKRNK